MTELDIVTTEPRGHESHIVLFWMPVAAFVGGSVLAQRLVLGSRYDVGGHAAGHLAGASAPFMAAGVLLCLFWATPLARRQPDVLAAAVLWFATTILVMVGNLRVVDDLVAAGYSHTPTDSVPDVADHSLANASIWYAVVAALLVVAVSARRRHIGTRATIGGIVSTLIFPPWIIPGAGVIVVTIVRVVRRARDRRDEVGGRPVPAAN
jgi:hypothetical protein